MVRRVEEEDAVSLFPFLSVLACVIGTLTLMIMALALGQMDTEEVSNAEDHENAKRQLARAQQDIKELIAKVGDLDVSLRELTDARAEKDELTVRFMQLTEDMPEKPEQVDVSQRLADLQQMEEELAELEKQLAALEEELAKRTAPPEEAVVMIRPGGTGVDIDPTFVECRSDSIVIYENKKPKRIPKSQIATDEAYRKLLDAVAGNKNRSVIFLIRDDAIGTYTAARNVAREKYARNGKLPVIGHGKLDLSMFEP